MQMQVERSLQKKLRGASNLPSSQDSNPSGFELTLIEVENERLREQAEALLRRQQVLEDLAILHQIIARQDGQLVWMPASAGHRGSSTAAGPGKTSSSYAAASPPSGGILMDKLEAAVIESRSKF